MTTKQIIITADDLYFLPTSPENKKLDKMCRLIAYLAEKVDVLEQNQLLGQHDEPK